MNQFTGIFFHMHFMNADFFLSGRSFDLYPSIMTDWQIQLGNLVVLRVIRIKIVLSVKFAVLVDLAVCCKSGFQCKFYYLTVQNRQRTRHTGADRTGMCIRSATKLCRASAENLCFCCKFYMDFKANDCLILFHAFLPPFSGVGNTPLTAS